MGREIRRVPPNWEHPKRENFDYRTGRAIESYQPMFDSAFAPKMREWYASWERWEAGERPEYAGDCDSFMEWEGGPPNPNYHRPDWKPEEMTWFQMYETVSEGTPVSPPFETAAELIDYLTEHGDFWDQNRGHGGWRREAAEKFVNAGWAPSGISVGGKVAMARDQDLLTE